MSDVWDRLYTQKTRNVRRRRNKLSPYVIRQQVTQGSVYKNGMNTVSPFKGASVRPNTAYMRRIERYIGHKAIPIDMNSSSQSTIILNAVDRPNTAPKVVNHVLCEQGSINQKISDQKGSFGTTRNIFGGLFA